MIKDGMVVCDNCCEELSPQPTAAELARREEDAQEGRHVNEIHAGCLDPSGALKLPFSHSR
jgi:hypothetical protein